MKNLITAPIMALGLILMATAQNVSATASTEGARDNEKEIRFALAQSDKLLESAAQTLSKQAAYALQSGASNILDQLNTQLAAGEARFRVISLNHFVGVNLPCPPQIREQQRTIANEIKANLEAQIQLVKKQTACGFVSSDESLLLELKLTLFLLEQHELLELNKLSLERKLCNIMESLLKLKS